MPISSSTASCGYARDWVCTNTTSASICQAVTSTKKRSRRPMSFATNNWCYIRIASGRNTRIRRPLRKRHSGYALHKEIWQTVAAFYMEVRRQKAGRILVAIRSMETNGGYTYITGLLSWVVMSSRRNMDLLMVFLLSFSWKTLYFNPCPIGPKPT